MKPYSVKKLSEVATISSVRKGDVYPKGSTLIQISASNGEVCYLESDSSVDSKYAVIQSLGLNDKYLNVILNKNISKFIHNYKQGLNISKHDLQYLPIEIVSDDLIEKLTNVIWLVNQQMDNIQSEIELLKELKKGFLQKMFPKNGERVPETRFPGFPEDWKERKLGEVTVKIGSGKTPKGGSAVYSEKGIPLLRSQNIYNDRVNFNDIVYITKDIDDSMANSHVLKDDVLLNITGASIGRSAVYSKEHLANVNQHVCIIRPGKNVNPFFIQLNITSPKGQKEIELNQAGGGREGLNFQQIARMTFFFPNKEEQAKIGTFFKQIDDTIAIHQRKLDLLKEMKKGFLQKMFTEN